MWHHLLANRGNPAFHEKGWTTVARKDPRFPMFVGVLGMVNGLVLTENSQEHLFHGKMDGFL